MPRESPLSIVIVRLSDLVRDTVFRVDREREYVKRTNTCSPTATVARTSLAVTSLKMLPAGPPDKQGLLTGVQAPTV